MPKHGKEVARFIKGSIDTDDLHIIHVMSDGCQIHEMHQLRAAGVAPHTIPECRWSEETRQILKSSGFTEDASDLI